MKHIRILILCIAFALLTGCAPAAQDTAAYAPNESERLVLYTSHKKEVWWPIVKEFESRTGIWVEVVQGGTNELLEQLQKEQDAPRADVMFGGGVESLEACRALFEPYVCRGAEQILPQYRAQDSSWTPFSSLPVVLVYNPKLLSSGQLSCWADLLDPALRGQIAFADPSVSGSSYTALVTMLCALGGDADEVLQTFAENLDGKLRPVQVRSFPPLQTAKRSSASRWRRPRASALLLGTGSPWSTPQTAQAAYRTAAPR